MKLFQKLSKRDKNKDCVSVRWECVHIKEIINKKMYCRPEFQRNKVREMKPTLC